MSIALPATSDALPRSLMVAANQAKEDLYGTTGLDLKIVRPGQADPKIYTIRCSLDQKAAISPKSDTARDAYRLRVSARGVEIAAPSTIGVAYGLQTFCQLVSPNGCIPFVDILDQPDFRDRGIMLDISRGKVPTRSTIEGLIDVCARLRLNVLQLYVEHTFDFHRHPEIGAGSSPIDAETILALDAYAVDRNVELLPCLQSLGHMERLLSLDRYAHLAESDRNWSVSPSLPATYTLLRELYDEFLPLFQSTRLNANCDEPFDLGRGQSLSRAPGKSAGALFADHVQQLDILSHEHNKQLMIWADFAYQHPVELSKLSRDVVLLDWWYEESFNGDRLRTLRRKGFEVWVCPGTSSWNCLFPRVNNSLGNISRWAASGRRHGATGLLNTDWGDFGHYNALGVSLQSYAWGAQEAWSGAVENDAFDRAFGARLFEEKGNEIGQIYRNLGDIHDAGFRVANGSALQYLYFDGLSGSFFLQHAKRKALERSEKKIARVLKTISRAKYENAGQDFMGLAKKEISWAADATHLAIRKGLAAIDFNRWRESPSQLTATARRRLAKVLARIADDQAAQLRGLQDLWLARNAISDFEKVRKRIRRSIAGLRGGARRLRENSPPRPAKVSDLQLLAVYDEIRNEMGMPPR